MSYATIRAAVKAQLVAALPTWPVEVGSRVADLDEYDLPRILYLIHDSSAYNTIAEIGGSSQEATMSWSLYYRIQHTRGRADAEDLEVHAAMETIALALGGQKLASSGMGPLERGDEENQSEDTETTTWRQSWRCYRYPA